MARMPWSLRWSPPATEAWSEVRRPCRRRLKPALHLPLDHHALDIGNCLRRIQVLRAGLGAIHDGVAAIEPERVFQIVQPLAGRLIARVDDPALRLQQRRRPEIAVRIPPIARAGCGAAGAQNALVEPVELLPVVVALLPFLLRRRR